MNDDDVISCPNCGSDRTHRVGGFFIDAHCRDCDEFYGEPFEELNRHLTDLKRELLKPFEKVLGWMTRLTEDDRDAP